MKSYFIFFLIVGLGSLSGCVSYNQLVNYEDNFPETAQVSIDHLPEIRIQPNDVLAIKVFSSEPQLAEPFNTSVNLENAINIQAMQLSGYLVDEEGGIDFPVLGRINFKGMSTSAAKSYLKEKLTQHLKDPVVNVRLLNFRITVSGEVRNPGSFTIVDERISLPDALAMAGDLTDHADRKEILLIREVDGQRTLNRLNLQSASFFESDLFYLKQNDLIYVRPIKAKAGAVQDQTSRTVSILGTAATLAAVLIALFQ